MRKAIVIDNLVVNVVTLPDDWTGKDGEWQPPPPPAQVIDAGEYGPGDSVVEID